LILLTLNCFTSTKVEKKLLKLIEIYKNKILPAFPIGANMIMSKYNIPEGKTLGNKLKQIEETWVQNNFQISEKQILKVIKG
jgi:poly(A) polymerase